MQFFSGVVKIDELWEIMILLSWVAVTLSPQPAWPISHFTTEMYYSLLPNPNGSCKQKLIQSIINLSFLWFCNVWTFHQHGDHLSTARLFRFFFPLLPYNRQIIEPQTLKDLREMFASSWAQQRQLIPGSSFASGRSHVFGKPQLRYLAWLTEVYFFQIAAAFSNARGPK